MGQEASLPEDPDFETQARAPPSSSSPLSAGDASTVSAGTSVTPTTTNGNATTGNFLHRLPANVGSHFSGHYASTSTSSKPPTGTKGLGFLHSHSQNHNDYETRETARATVSGNGHNAGYMDNSNAMMESPAVFLDSTVNSTHTSSFPNGGRANQRNNESASNITDGSILIGIGGLHPDRSSGSSKRGLFGTPGRTSGHSRGAAIINSMRNLSLSKALSGKSTTPTASKPTVGDWEKQWDEDDDDDDDDDDDESDEEDHLREDMIGYSSSASLPTTPRGVDYLSSAGEASTQLVTPCASPLTAAPSTTPNDLLSMPIGAVLDDSKPCVEMFLPMLRVLGKGSFGKVVLVQKRCGKERGQLFAMKILRKTHLVKRRQIERTRTERKVLSAVNHPFIMKLHYAFQSEDKLYLVLDYCPGGELFFHLSRCRRFPERVARFYSAQLLLAIGHLHKRGIIYRDLKPENVLLDAEGHVKLGDFGLAKAGIISPVEGAISMCGTPEYMAPEVLAQLGHGFCVDYWGLGMLTYEMMTGLPPWYTTDRQKLFRRLKSAPLDIPNFFTPAAADCVSVLLERNPRRRLGVGGIRSAMEHEFFRNISWRSLYARRIEAPVKPCESWKPPDLSTAQDGSDLLSGSKPSSTNLVDIEKLNSHELDAATSNFDSTFLRMPVESEDFLSDDPEDAVAAQELHNDTFLGFTFDIKVSDHGGQVSPTQKMSPIDAQAARQRSHHF